MPGLAPDTSPAIAKQLNNSMNNRFLFLFCIPISLFFFLIKLFLNYPTFPDSKKQVTAQNKATPSIKADIIRAVVLISPAASGCLPVASAAAAVIFPIPSAAPKAVSYTHLTLPPILLV